MVTNVTSLTGNGLKDWLIQRITAVYLMIYSIFFLSYLLTHPGLEYEQWTHLFHSKIMSVATILALLTLSWHAWIGIWTVTTDYIRCTVLRLSLQVAVALGLFSQFVWGLMILWGQ